MSFNRNKGEDLKRTMREMRSRSVPVDGKNWLGHGEYTGAARMDEMLLEGASIEILLTSGRRTRASVNMHLHHLKTEHGLPISRDQQGKYKFDLKT